MKIIHISDIHSGSFTDKKAVNTVLKNPGGEGRPDPFHRRPGERPGPRDEDYGCVQ